MDHTETLDYLVKKVSPKGWTKFIKTRPEFLAWLNHQTPYKTANVSELVYLVKNSQQSPICEFNKKRIFKNFYEGYRIGCGKHCECAKNSQKSKLKNWHKNLDPEKKKQLVENAKETFREKYGVDNPFLNLEVQKKAKQTNMQRYGAATPFESDVIRNKIKKVIKEKYGVDSPLQSPDIQKKARITYIQNHGKLMSVARAAKEAKYGTASWTKEQLEKFKNTIPTKYGVETPFLLPQVRNKINEKQKDRLLEKYGKEVYETLNDPVKFTSFVTGKSAYAVINELNLKGDGSKIISLARKYNCLDVMNFEPQSAMEEDLSLFLEKNGVEFKRNDKTLIAPLQLDFLLVNHSLAIELHGLFHHSELSLKKSSTYHLNKHKKCLENGIQLIQIYQDEYWNKKSIVQNMILSKCGRITSKADARKMTARKIKYGEASLFYQNNHILGKCWPTEINYGLFQDDILYAAISFQKKKHEVEIVRFAALVDMNVRGGFQKLLKFSMDNIEVESVVTYSDNRLSLGKLYESSGFTKVAESLPSYDITDYKSRYSSQLFTRPKIQKQFGIDIENKTTWECIQEIGYDRIWDCGKIRWRYEYRH